MSAAFSSEFIEESQALHKATPYRQGERRKIMDLVDFGL